MNIENVLAAIDRGLLSLQEAKAALTETVPDRVVVRAGESLRAALDKGGPIELEAGTWGGTYTIPSNTSLTGRPGAKIHGLTGPALIIAPGTSDVTVSDLELSSGRSEVVSLGNNDDGVNTTQTTIEDAPERITFANVRIPTHRGKRGYGIHARNVQLLDCEVLDCWDPAGQDSQAVYIGNTPGPVTIRGGRYSAGSCVVLAGGDTTRIPHVTPADLLFEDVELFRPLSWMTDGVPRKVKNLFEIKNGRRVILRRSTLSGCWANGQQGEAIVLTPALDGSRKDPPERSGEVDDVLIEDVTISDCGSVANLLGRAYQAYTVVPLRAVVFRRVTATVNRATYGGRGQLALIQGEPEDVTFEDCTFTGDGSSVIYYSPGVCIDPVTKLSRAAGKVSRLTLIDSRCTVGAYGLFLGGYANARNWQASVGVLDVRGNAFTGSQLMKTALPENTYG